MKNGKFSNTIFSKLRFCWQLPHNFYEISVTVCARQTNLFVLHSGHIAVVHNRELFSKNLSQNLVFRKEGQNFYPYPIFLKTRQKKPLEKKTKTLFWKIALLCTASEHGLLKKRIIVYPTCLLLPNCFTAWASTFVYFWKKKENCAKTMVDRMKLRLLSSFPWPFPYKTTQKYHLKSKIKKVVLSTHVSP